MKLILAAGRNMRNNLRWQCLKENLVSIDFDYTIKLFISIAIDCAVLDNVVLPTFSHVNDNLCV